MWRHTIPHAPGSMPPPVLYTSSPLSRRYTWDGHTYRHGFASHVRQTCVSTAMNGSSSGPNRSRARQSSTLSGLSDSGFGGSGMATRVEPGGRYLYPMVPHPRRLPWRYQRGERGARILLGGRGLPEPGPGGRMTDGRPNGGPDASVREIVARNLRFDLQRGRVELLGARILLIPPEFIVQIQKQLEATIGASAKGVLSLAGERTGQSVVTPGVERLVGLRAKAAAEEIFRGIAEVSALRGVGGLRVVEVGPGARGVRFQISDGSIPEAYGPSKRPGGRPLAGGGA